MKTNKLLQFGIFVGILVITDCIVGKKTCRFLDLYGSAGSLRQHREKGTRALPETHDKYLSLCDEHRACAQFH